MERSRPSFADFLGFCAYLFAIEAGAPGDRLFADIASGYRVLQNGYGYDEPEPAPDIPAVAAYEAPLPPAPWPSEPPPVPIPRELELAGVAARSAF